MRQFERELVAELATNFLISVLLAVGFVAIYFGAHALHLI